MSSPDLATLHKLLQERSGFSDFASAIGRIVREGDCDASECLKTFLVGELISAGSEGAFENDSLNIVKHFKLGLGLGILVAGQPTPESQSKMLDDTFVVLLNRHATSRQSRLLLLTEICYMDQFVDIRVELNKVFAGELKNNKWSPAIRDYLLAWENAVLKREYTEEFVEKADSPKLIIVMSAKGGTGKSITAAAVANYLLSKGKKVGVIDLDSSGPTAQYIYNIKEVVRSMSELPTADAAHSNTDAWCFPTFLDILRACSENRHRSSLFEINGNARYQAAKRAVLHGASGSNMRFICIPESPTFCAEVAQHWNERDPRSLIEALDLSIEALVAEGCDHIVLDLAPGVYGTNGTIVEWAARYPALPILLTSARASDVATSIYEAPWLASDYPFKWRLGPLLHLINRWEAPGQCGKILKNWSDRSIDVALAAASSGNFCEISSATQIHAKRFWPLYYQLGLDATPDNDDILEGKQQRLTYLPEDPIIRTILSLATQNGDKTSFRVDVGELHRTAWYKRLAALLDRHFKEGD